ncbi:MAG: class I SAM-dependent DNA methyltransferase [Promethearchaeota archaeon]
MIDSLILNKKISLILGEIERELTQFEKLLDSRKIQQTLQYNKWYKYFVKIYGSTFTDLRLYLLFALLYFLGYLFILKSILKRNIFSHFERFTIEKFENLQDKIKEEYNEKLFFSDDYFSPFFEMLEDMNQNSYIKFLNIIDKEIFGLEIPKDYFFSFFIQNFFSNLVRHRSGEFYTPKFLAKKMVEESYEFGEKVLDPSCGSANFLVEVLKIIISSNKSEEEKIVAINNLYGYDINPISIFIGKVNFFFLLGEKVSRIKFNFFITDALFLSVSRPKERFDLVIGNPPWYTLRDIESIESQRQIKQLAEKLNIKPRPKNVLNIEMASLFFYKAKYAYMKENAKIFFVITKGIMNGSHASRFRSFEGFSDVKIWQFKSNIEKIFNIDFICLYAKKSESNLLHNRLEIPVYYYNIAENQINPYCFEDCDLYMEKKEIFIPYHIEKKDDKTYIHKLISKEEYQKLLFFKQSKYKKLFHKGADLNPRNLIFIKFERFNNSLVKINPDERIFKRAKAPWNKKEFNNEIIENQYIFKVIKSTELVRFFIYNFYDVFLPLSKEDLSFNYSRLAKYAKDFYDKINYIYLRNKKETTKNKSLMDNLNRWSKLINPRQIAKIKVVYNNSGSVLNSAVIIGDFLVTGDLSFYNTKNIEEAYYLSAILNSPLINKQIRIKKSSRHIFKIPFENPVKIFNPEDENHKILADLGRKGQMISKSIYETLIKREKQIPSKLKIQKCINKELRSLLKQIDKRVIKEF